MTALEKGKAWLNLEFSIIPCGLNKRPLIPKERGGWAPFQDRKPDLEEIAAWCEEWPELQWGIVTGPVSNLTVVDADCPRAAEAVKALLPDPKAVVTVKTCNDGHEQYWFQCDLDIPQTQVNKELQPAPEEWIDIRNWHGFVMAPGSKAFKKDAHGNLTTDTGNYRLNQPPDQNKPMAEFIEERGKVPPGLKAHLLTSRPLNTNGSTPPPVFPAVQEGEKIARGLREGYLFNKALSLVDAGLPRPVIEDAVSTLARDYCEPGDLPDPRAKVQAAYVYRAKNPKTWTSPTIKEPDAPKKPEVPADPAAFDFSKILMTGAEMQTLDIHVDWTVDKLIPERGLTLIYGPGGVGKTWLALAIAKAVSMGLPFLGLPTKQKPVFYIDRENPWPLLIERVCKMDVRDARFWHLSFKTQPPKLDVPDWILYKKLPTGGLVFFDTARSCHDGDENSSQDVGLIMNRLKELRELNNDIALLHHTPRLNERSVKGSTAWEDLADQVIGFYRVRKGSLKEIKEEIDAAEYDPDALYHLGTGKKTRYTPAKFYLTTNFDTGEFTLADDPGALIIDALAEYIGGEGNGQNQTEIHKWAKDNVDGCGRKDKFIATLNRGSREDRWRVRPGFRGAKYYEPPT